MLAADANGANVTTIEGFVRWQITSCSRIIQKHHGLQCGYCTPGMVMSSIDLLKTHKNPSDEEIRKGLEGNICRCTGYQNIVASVKGAIGKV